MIQKQSVGFYYLAPIQNHFYLSLRTGLAIRNRDLFRFYLPLRVDLAEKISIFNHYLPLRVNSSEKIAKQDLSFQSSIRTQRIVAHLSRSSQQAVARLLRAIENLKRKIPGSTYPFHYANHSDLSSQSLRTGNRTFATCYHSVGQSLRIDYQSGAGMDVSDLLLALQHSVARLLKPSQLSVARLLEIARQIVAHLMRSLTSVLRANPRFIFSPAILDEPLLLLRTDETARKGVGLNLNLSALTPLAKYYYSMPEKNLPNLLGPPLCQYCYQQFFMYMSTKTSVAKYILILLLRCVSFEIGRAHV